MSLGRCRAAYMRTEISSIWDMTLAEHGQIRLHGWLVSGNLRLLMRLLLHGHAHLWHPRHASKTSHGRNAAEMHATRVRNLGHLLRLGLYAPHHLI